MKLKPAAKIKRNKSVIFKEVDETVYILDPRNSTVHTLNETASFIWRCLKKPCTLKRLVSLMIKEFDVEAKKAAVDLEDFILQYLKEQFLVRD